jgi:hypothetical protein
LLKKFSLYFFSVLLLPISASAAEQFPYKISGEFRGSYQYIRERGPTYLNQKLQRMSAILGIEAEPAKDFTLGFQIATGTTNPTSRFQNLGSSWTRKSVGIDLAFVRWQPESIDTLFLELGKVTLPFYRMMGSQLIFDRDVNPEGLSFGVSPKLSEMQLEFRAGHYVIEERTTSSESYLIGAQALTRINLLPDKWRLILGSSFYPYRHVAGKSFFGAGSNRRGNSTVTTGLYSEEYRLGEAFLESTFFVRNLPLTLGYQLVKNIALKKENFGWLGSFRVGRIKEKGDWEAQAFYRVLDRDAVLGAFNEGDFAGGGTNVKGYDARVAHAIRDNIRGVLVYINSENNISGASSSYKRYRADLILSF